MAKGKDAGTETAGKTAEKAVKAETKARAEPKFTVVKLREHSMRLFGLTQSAFDGAMYGRATDEELTVKEAQDILNSWLYGTNVGKGGRK